MIELRIRIIMRLCCRSRFSSHVFRLEDLKLTSNNALHLAVAML